MFEVCRTPPLLKQHEAAIVESGCTVHFLLVNAPCLNKVKYRTPLTVLLPNGSNNTDEFDISELNDAASKAYVFPGMANHSLLSVGQLCDEGYIVTFKQASVTICNSEKSQILAGTRDLITGLWRINLKQDNNHTPEPIENNVYELRNTGSLVHYLHKALFSPTKSAMLQAVARPNGIRYPQTFETDTGYGHGPYKPATPKHKIYLEAPN
jgi:hypothetical protein